MPVVGRNLIFTPTWINTWKIINNIDPIKTSLFILFFSDGIFLNTLNIKSKKMNKINNIIKIPNSSEIT